LWSPPEGANQTVFTFVDTLMSRVLSGVSGDVIKVDYATEIERACPTNFNLRSECFAAVVFNSVDTITPSLVRLARAAGQGS
jgi:hypothetical protein